MPAPVSAGDDMEAAVTDQGFGQFAFQIWDTTKGWYCPALWEDSNANAVPDTAGVTTLVSGQSEPVGVAVDSGHVYWADHGTGTVMAANLDGIGVTTLVTGQSLPEAVAVWP